MGNDIIYVAVAYGYIYVIPHWSYNKVWWVPAKICTPSTLPSTGALVNIFHFVFHAPVLRHGGLLPWSVLVSYGGLHQGQMKTERWKAHAILLLLAVNEVVSSANFHQVPSLASITTNTQSGLMRLGRRSNGALASVLRLRGAEGPRQEPPPATTFREQLRERFKSVGSSNPPSSSVVLDRGSNRRGMSALAGRVARVVKNGLMQSGSKVRRRGLLALLAVACVLSVVGATTSGVVSRPWGRWHESTQNLAVVGPSADVDNTDASSTSGKGSERRRRLLKMPRFPLAYMRCWKALQDRHKVRGAAVYCTGGAIRRTSAQPLFSSVGLPFAAPPPRLLCLQTPDLHVVTTESRLVARSDMTGVPCHIRSILLPIDWSTLIITPQSTAADGVQQ